MGKSVKSKPSGITLIELIIVMAIVGILLTIAVPAYTQYMLRVHRSEAITRLLQASMCQESISARTGRYDTGQCLSNSGRGKYQLSYTSANQRGLTYMATATPKGGQRSDPCGSLSLDQSGMRAISGNRASTTKCWNGR